MKKLLTLLSAAALSAAAFVASAQTQASIAEMVADNPNLSQGQVSSDTYTVVTKNVSTGAVTNTQVTVVSVGPDVMFVRDAGQKLLAVERPMSKPALNTFYKAGNKIESLVVRYKANYVTRGSEQVPIPYSVFEMDEYTKTAQTININYNMCPIPNYVAARDYAVVALGKGSSLNETVEATWNADTEEFDFDYTSGTTTYTMHIKAGAMGINCAAFQPGTWSVYAAGVLQPTDTGFDIYPNVVRQDALVQVTNIAAAREIAQDMESSNGESYNEFHINSQVRINAICGSRMFIQDASGAMLVKAGSGVNLAATGLKAGDLIDGITLNLYYGTQYGTEIYGIYKSTTLPEASGYQEIDYPLVTLATLRDNKDQYNCHAVMLEDVRVKSDGKYEGTSVNPSDFFPGFVFNTRQYYTIKAIYQGDYNSLSVVWAEASGDVPAMVPIDVANIEELLEKGADLTSGKMSEDIYRITGKVTVMKNNIYMYIQDASAAAPVAALANSSIQNAPYTMGSVVENLCLRVQNANGLIQGYYDIDESQWPEPIDGEFGLPQIINADDVDASVEFRWMNVRGVVASSRTAFKLDGLRITSSPNVAATITCNANLGAPSISFTTGDIYNVTGLFVGSHGATGITRWQFYASAWEKSASTNPTPVDGIAELKETLANLDNGATSADSYKLSPVYVTVRTADKIFAQDSEDGMAFASANANYNLAGFAYEYGDVVNGFQGKVKKEDNAFTMLLDPMAFPASTMNLPFIINVEDILFSELADNKFVMVAIEDVIVEQSAARSGELTANGIALCTDVINADEESDAVEPNAMYNLKGVFDGETFYVYSADFTRTVGIQDITANGAEIEGIYTLSGLRTNTLSEGINIVRLTDGTVKKIIIRK